MILSLVKLLLEHGFLGLYPGHILNLVVGRLYTLILTPHLLVLLLHEVTHLVHLALQLGVVHLQLTDLLLLNGQSVMHFTLFDQVLLLCILLFVILQCDLCQAQHPIQQEVSLLNQ